MLFRKNIGAEKCWGISIDFCSSLWLYDNFDDIMLLGFSLNSKVPFDLIVFRLDLIDIEFPLCSI